MPVVMYSKIKIRRGLQEDLPNPLDSAELGFSQNKRTLYIGNGSIDEGAPVIGNTEILTAFSDNTSIIKYTYTANNSYIPQTGPTTSQPIYRSLQSKLNDIVCIKDFGALGNGVTYDDNAINRAIQQIYNNNSLGAFTDESKYKIIFFPAGKYLLLHSIQLPPNTYILGEGKGRTIFSFDGQSPFIMETVDSLFQRENQIHTNNAALPSNIMIKDITIKRENIGNFINFNRVNNLIIDNCEMIGNNTYNGNQPDISSIFILNNFGYIHSNFNIKIFNSSFSNVGNIIKGDPSNNILFDNCIFDKFYNGFSITNQKNWKLMNNIFTNIEINDINILNSSNIVLMNNIADNVLLNGDNCSSINNNFANFNNNSQTAIILNAGDDLIVGNTIYSQKRTFTLLPNQNGTIIPYDFLKDQIFIDYVVLRNGERKIGSLKICNFAGIVDIYDIFNETAPTGITFSVEYNNKINLSYISTDGSTSEFIFSFKAF